MNTAHPGALDALLFNTDRYEGYKVAAKETHDKELKQLFSKFSLQSKRFVKELKQLISSEQAKDLSTNPFKFYRIHHNLRSRLSNKHRKAALACFEYLEYLAKKTYDELLRNPGSLPKKALGVIRKQRDEIQLVHENVKQMCDSIK